LYFHVFLDLCCWC